MKETCDILIRGGFKWKKGPLSILPNILEISIQKAHRKISPKFINPISFFHTIESPKLLNLTET
jgi:hypothetical protein